MEKDLYCPECRKAMLDRSGKVVSGRHYLQRYVCRGCLRCTVHPLVTLEPLSNSVTNKCNPTEVPMVSTSKPYRCSESIVTTNRSDE
jgi:transposase-like protein